VAKPTLPNLTLTERDLSRWRLVEAFQKRLARAAQGRKPASTWTDARRQLQDTDYLSLFLLGLLNPVVGTMRGLCAASRLARVQREVCTRPVSLGSFSEAQAVLDPELLAAVFTQLSQEVACRRGPRLRRDAAGSFKTAVCLTPCRACIGHCGDDRAGLNRRCGCI
jgi:hypothetical protein